MPDPISISEEATPPQRNSAGFVVQGNPKKFDVDAYLARQPYVYWMWPQNHAVQLGMPVFIKRTGPGGGLVARGVIAELPTMVDELAHPDLLGDDLWLEPLPDATPKVGIELLEVRLTPEEGMLPTSQLVAIPELDGRPLAVAPRATVFRLSLEHLAAIQREWGDDKQWLGVGEEIDGVTEGERVLRRHFRVERNSWIVKEKKRQCRNERGGLCCDVCQADFLERYGELWDERAIDAHHTRPLADLSAPAVTRLEDLLLVCATCHRLIHQSADVEENLDRLRTRFQSEKRDA